MRSSAYIFITLLTLPIACTSNGLRQTPPVKQKTDAPRATQPSTRPIVPPIALVDPALLVVPSAPPPPRRLLSEADYQARKNAFEEHYGTMMQWQSSTAPGCGALVVDVDKDSQAEHLHLQSGDVLVRLGAYQIYSQYFSNNAGRVQTLVVNRDGKTFPVQVQPGPIGVSTITVWRPGLLYLRSRHRDARWDQDMFIACAAAIVDPHLAETALARAIAEGYPDNRMIEEAAANIAAADGRGEWALTHILYANLEPVGDTILYSGCAFQAAIANFKLQQALEGLAYAPDQMFNATHDYLQKVIEVYKAQGPSTWGTPSPEKLSALWRHIPLQVGQHNMKGVPDWDGVIDDYPVRQFNDARPAPITNSFAVRSSNSLQNCELSFDFKIQPNTDSVTQQSDCFFSAGLFDDTSNYDPDSASGGDCEFAIFPNGNASISLGIGLWGPQFATACVCDGSHSYSIRMIRCAGRDAIILNKKRIFYVPSTTRRQKTGFFLKIVGMKGVITQLKFDELVPVPIVPDH